MSERDKLFNALLEAVVEHGKGVEIGLVRAVLQEVDGTIAMAMGRLPLESIEDRLKKELPHRRRNICETRLKSV